MSRDPYSEQPAENPYAAPATPPEPHLLPNPLLIPAVILLVLSGLYLIVLVLSLPQQWTYIASRDPATSDGMGQLVGALGSLVTWALMNGAIFAGAMCMLRGKNYPVALWAAYFAMIPVCSPFFVAGIPFGIWAAILLHKPHVRQRFE